MPSHKRVAVSDDPDRDLMKAMAMDIGKDIVAYVEQMYPQAVSAASSSFRLSLRNSIYNRVMSAFEGPSDHDEIKARLEANAKHRRELGRIVKRSRETDHEATRADPAKREAELEDIRREWWRDENFEGNLHD